MKITETLKSVEELLGLAAKVLDEFKKDRVFAFYAPMGAGKTTFIKAFCSALGVKDTISSPTFSLVNEYKAVDKAKIFHFDFYRIKTITEAYDMGYEDYFYSSARCLIEWPERIEELLPENYVKVSIVIGESGERIFTFENIEN